MTSPNFIYKYRHPKSIEDLLLCRTRFSCRKNFNDPFDSNIEIMIPSAKDLKKLTHNVGVDARNEIFKLINKNDITNQIPLHFGII